MSRNFRSIYIVIDKPDYLPPPRVLVHQSRAEKTNKCADYPQAVADGQRIPHNGFTSLLSTKQFKEDLIKYISFRLTSKCVLTSGTKPITFVIDSTSAPSPFLIQGGSIQKHPTNEHGESDYAVWHHGIHSPSRNIVIFSGDTDTWVYGLDLYELGWLNGKSVTVQRAETNQYVNIATLAYSISSHPKLQQIHHPVCCLVAVYVLSGCDYTTSFFGCTKDRFLNTFMTNALYICAESSSNSLVVKEDGMVEIQSDAWIRLITSVYFSKHSDFFRHKTVTDVYNLLTNHPDSEEGNQLLSWVNFDGPVTTTEEWHQFVQKVTFHTSSVTHMHNAKLLPTMCDLLLHL